MSASALTSVTQGLLDKIHGVDRQSYPSSDSVGDGSSDSRSLIEQRDALEARLANGLAVVDRMIEDGRDTSAADAKWIGLLRQYEGVCDRIAALESVEASHQVVCHGCGLIIELPAAPPMTEGVSFCAGCGAARLGGPARGDIGTCFACGSKEWAKTPDGLRVCPVCHPIPEG